MVKIDDEVMETLGKQLDNNTYELEGKLYKILKTHQVEPYCYYVELESR